MSRYVDAEWLIKESMPLSFSVQKWVNEVQIMTAPSIDIVFCKECKRWDKDRGERNNMQFKGYCKLLSGFTDAKHFCAWSIPHMEESRLLDIGMEMERRSR